MIIKINENDLELKYSFRVDIYFEQIEGHPLDLRALKGNDLLTLFYCVVIASLQKAKQPIITMEEFMDAIDDNGGGKKLLEFAEWYVNTMKTEYDVLGQLDDNKKKKTKKPNSKKN